MFNPPTQTASEDSRDDPRSSRQARSDCDFQAAPIRAWPYRQDRSPRTSKRAGSKVVGGFVSLGGFGVAAGLVLDRRTENPPSDQVAPAVPVVEGMAQLAD